MMNMKGKGDVASVLALHQFDTRCGDQHVTCDYHKLASTLAAAMQPLANSYAQGKSSDERGPRLEISSQKVNQPSPQRVDGRRSSGPPIGFQSIKQPFEAGSSPGPIHFDYRCAAKILFVE
jgi:hypothetical protein